MRAHSDVVIVGGGIVGATIAYQLADEVTSVTVIERDSIGSHASGFALGLLNPTNETGNTESLNHESFRMHEELLGSVQEESGVDVQVLTMPHIELALTEAEIPTLKAEWERIGEIPNFGSTWLGPEEVRKLDHRITEDVYGGVLVEDVIVLDSYNLTLATVLAAEARGVEVVPGVATGLIFEKDRVAGVMLGQNRISCDAVVLALGPWSGATGAWLDVDIPVVPQKGEIARVQGLDPALDVHIHGFTLGSSISVVQKADGEIWLAATVQDGTGFDVSPSSQALDSLSLRGIRIVPGLESHQLTLQTACLRPVTPDNDPVLGKVPGKDGVFIATGTTGKGVLLAPIIGKAIADLVCTGETNVAIAQFGLERFRGQVNQS